MRVLYLQPYVPTYRAPLFSCLDALLREGGGSLTVAASQPSRAMVQRRDQCSGTWLNTVRTIPIPTPLGTLHYRDVRQSMRTRPDVVVMELDPANLNAWTAVTRRRIPVVLWGHGKTFTARERPLVARARAHLARAAQHVMTYTEAGRQALLVHGVPENKVSAVGNATDTRELRRALQRRRQSDTRYSQTFRISLRDRRVFMYVGALDADKRVSFLAAAARHAATLDPRFLLLVAGSGPDEGCVRSLDSDVARWIPRADLPAIADMLAVSEGIWMPGRIGLVAVDALAAGVPIHTTAFPFHAPEFEFLAIGRDAFLHPDNPALFAKYALTGSPDPRTTLQTQPIEGLSVESVASNMFRVLQEVQVHPLRR